MDWETGEGGDWRAVLVILKTSRGGETQSKRCGELRERIKVSKSWGGSLCDKEMGRGQI